MKSCILALFYLLTIVAVSTAFSPKHVVVIHSMARLRHGGLSPLRTNSEKDQSDDYLSEPVQDNMTGEPNIVISMDSSMSSQTEENIIGRLRRMMTNVKGLQGKEKKLDRQALAKLGTNVLLAYGFVSNAFGAVSVSCAWYIASKRSGLSPLAPGQWKAFTAAYAGFYILSNIIRPFRFALSIAISPYWERAIQNLQERFNVSKPVAFGLVVFLMNVCGTFALMASGILTASLLSGVPIWAVR